MWPIQSYLECKVSKGKGLGLRKLVIELDKQDITCLNQVGITKANE